MAYNKAEKSDSPMRRKGGIRRRKKVCVFCGKDNVIDYKDVNKLKRYMQAVLRKQKNISAESAHGIMQSNFLNRRKLLIPLLREKKKKPLHI